MLFSLFSIKVLGRVRVKGFQKGSTLGGARFRVFWFYRRGLCGFTASGIWGPRVLLTQGFRVHGFGLLGFSPCRIWSWELLLWGFGFWGQKGLGFSQFPPRILKSGNLRLGNLTVIFMLTIPYVDPRWRLLCFLLRASGFQSLIVECCCSHCRV